MGKSLHDLYLEDPEKYAKMVEKANSQQKLLNVKNNKLVLEDIIEEKIEEQKDASS